jgi:hypothetical protein
MSADAKVSAFLEAAGPRRRRPTHDPVPQRSAEVPIPPLAPEPVAAVPQAIPEEAPTVAEAVSPSRLMAPRTDVGTEGYTSLPKVVKATPIERQPRKKGYRFLVEMDSGIHGFMEAAARMIDDNIRGSTGEGRRLGMSDLVRALAILASQRPELLQAAEKLMASGATGWSPRRDQ